MPSAFRYMLPDATATEQAGAALARVVRAGDVLLLSGPLGAGKTALARGFIRALLGEDVPVPSPTYTLVQHYDTPTLAIIHADLYRLRHPAELEELGLWEQQAGSVLLVEWPEVAGSAFGPEALHLTLAHAGAGRELVGSGDQAWYERLACLRNP